MVIKEEQPEAQQQTPPFLGRSVRVVSTVEPVDAQQTPHEKNKRGELGAPLFNYYNNSTARDPIGRIGTGNHAADRRNVMQVVVNQAPRGGVSPNKTEVRDPKVMAQHIKDVARFLGADVIGVARTFPGFLYKAGRYPDDGNGPRVGGGASDPSERLGPTERAAKYPFAISAGVAWNYDMGKAHRHRIGDATYHFALDEAQVLMVNLAAYIRELGYNAVQGVTQPMPVALAAGIGQHARNGLLITEKFGSRMQLGDIILTDLPLVPDEPIDIGVTDFCNQCNKCAKTCPTNSITMEGKAVVNGVEKYKINWETCYRLRPYVLDHWEICLTCVTVCPYTKPNTWWHQLAIQSIKRTPIPLRSLVIKPIKWLDDAFWGRVPRKRVRWMGYDSGRPPVQTPPQALKVISSTLQQADAPAADSKMGYYYPLKENTRRFEILKEKSRARK
jgi:epoxyqueuosine reductase QueG